MHVLASRRLTIMLLIAVIGMAGALVVGIGTTWGHPGAHRTNDTALLTTNRDGLKICVESLVPDLEEQQIQGQVRGALTKVSNHPDFQDAGLGRQPIAIDTGCPSEPTIRKARYDSRERIGAPDLADEPSGYRTFVYVASQEELDAAFGDRRLHITPQEELCEENDICGVVTVAVYLTPEELMDRPLLERSLTHGVGLWPVDEPRFDPTSPPEDPRGK